MSLKNIRESVSISAASVIDDVEVVVFTARVEDSGIAGPITQLIRNYELYNAHRAETRRDKSEFQELVWNIEDRIMALNVEEEGIEVPEPPVEDPESGEEEGIEVPEPPVEDPESGEEDRLSETGE